MFTPPSSFDLNPSHSAGRRPRRWVLSLILLPILATGACQSEGDRVPLDQRGGAQGTVDPLPPEIQLRLDSANAAYRARDYEEALELFSRVAELAPDLAAGWYGMGMTHGAMGNQEEADSAMMQAHRLAPEIPLDHPGPAPRNPHQMDPEGADPHLSPPRESRNYEGENDGGI